MSQISQNILQRVSRYLDQHHLLPPVSDGSKGGVSAPLVLVGLSGGPDSVALLHILHRLGYRCEALHCNFHLRGDESQRDEAFCRQFCQTLGVALRVQQFDTFGYMKEQHLSLEMAARRLRYDWWATILQSADADVRIALGHHQDDSIETALMNLMRGTGIHGLTGIVPYNAATHVIRPLLCLGREEILDYLDDNGLAFVTDSTNADNDTLRNQIRNQLLPLMQQLVPQVRTGIGQTIGHLNATAEFADAYLGQFDALTEHHQQWGIDWHQLSLERLTSQLQGQAAEDYLFDWQRRFCSPLTHRIVHTSKFIYTQPLDDGIFDAHRPTLCQEASLLPDALFAERFDADTLCLPLSLRRWQEGDRMKPLGMQGHTKLLSDLFSNAHYSPMQKATTWLVTDATGDIIWAIGLHISDAHKITDKTTHTLTLSVR